MVKEVALQQSSMLAEKNKMEWKGAHNGLGSVEHYNSYAYKVDYHWDRVNMHSGTIVYTISLIV